MSFQPFAPFSKNIAAGNRDGSSGENDSENKDRHPFTLVPCAPVNLSLILVGAVKLLLGIFLGGLGVVLAYAVLSRLLRSARALEDNTAAGVLHASALLSLSMLAKNSLLATYDTIDLTMHAGKPTAVALLKVLAHGVMHVGLALGLGTGLLFLGVWLFNKLTPGVDEVKAVGEGKVAPALVLGAILFVLALLAAPGLEALLAGLVPFPQLPANTMVPST